MNDGPSAKVLFVGALTEDRIYQADGFGEGPGKYPARNVHRCAAGMATSAATAAARLGGDVTLWASVGGDAVGASMIREIEAENIDCSNVRVVEGGRSASATIVVDARGERWVVTDYDPLTQASPLELPKGLRPDFAAVMADVRWPGAARLALEAARSAGRPAVLDADVATRPILEALSPLATHVVASEPGASILLGDRGSPPEMALRLARRYGTIACVTAGAQGTYWSEGSSGKVELVESPRVTAVDTLSAGDVFHGALTLALAEGKPVTSAIRFGSAAAALKCTRFGGRLGAPGRRETEDLIRDTYDG